MSQPSLALLITEKANADEHAIFRYITEVFGSLYAERFRTKLIQLFQLVATQPFIGRVAKNDSYIRVLIISKQNKFIYKVTDSAIIILRILNTKTAKANRF